MTRQASFPASGCSSTAWNSAGWESRWPRRNRAIGFCDGCLAALVAACDATAVEFESNLSKLGYGGFTVDRTFTAQTTTAVKRWQKDLGAPQSGTVGTGDVFYAAGPLRVLLGVAPLG